jgi:hypothetical protein
LRISDADVKMPLHSKWGAIAALEAAAADVTAAHVRRDVAGIMLQLKPESPSLTNIPYNTQ